MTISRGKPSRVSARVLALCCMCVGTIVPTATFAAPCSHLQSLRSQAEADADVNASEPVIEPAKTDVANTTDLGTSSTVIDQPAPSLPPVATVVAPPAAVAVRNRESLPLGPMPAGNVLPKAGLSGDSQSSAASAFAAFWPLAIVVAIILGAAYFVRKLAKGDPGLVAALGAGGKSPSGVLEVLGRYPVSRTSSFILLRLDRRILLLNQSFGKAGTGFSTLAELTDAEEVASILIKVNQGETKSMNSYLDMAMKQMEKEPLASESGTEEPVDTVDVSFPAMGGLRRPNGFAGGVS